MTTPPSLREALIDAGLALLAEGGASALTLRRAAARAGVSHAAPAHHFAGLPGLMTAMAVRAYDSFAAALARGRAAAEDDPVARLHGLCRGYLDFAEGNAGLFHLLFVATEPDRGDADLGRASSAAYGLLRETCAPLTGGIPDVVFEVGVWSLVHGYALLGLQSPESSKRQFIPVPSFDLVLDRHLGRTVASPQMPLATACGSG